MRGGAEEDDLLGIRHINAAPGDVVQDSLFKPESTEGGRGVSVLKRRKGAPVHLG